jgi:hypothetical protein
MFFCHISILRYLGTVGKQSLAICQPNGKQSLAICQPNGKIHLLRSVAQLVRAPRLGRGGPRFEPGHSDSVTRQSIGHDSAYMDFAHEPGHSDSSYDSK